MGGVSYALYTFGVTGGALAGAVIGQIVLLIFGFVSLRRTTANWFKIEVPLVAYAWGMVAALLDAVTFFVAALSTLFVVRAYHVFHINEREGDASKGYRSYVWRQLAMTVVDWLLLPFVVLLFVAHWRWSTARREIDALKHEGERRLCLLVSDSCSLARLLAVPFNWCGVVCCRSTRSRR